MRQHSTIRRHRTDRLMTGTSFKEDPGTRIKSIAPCNIFGSQDLATQADGITDRRVEMSQRKSVRSEEVLKRRESFKLTVNTVKQERNITEMTADLVCLRVLSSTYSV